MTKRDFLAVAVKWKLKLYMTHGGTGAGADLRTWDINVLEGSRVVILNPRMAELYVVSPNKASCLESSAYSL